MRDYYPVIVVGGGMVGATAACILASAGVEVALLDCAEPQRIWPVGSVDLRVSAISRASRNILDAIKVWSTICQRGVSPYKEMRVWDAKGTGELHFDCADTEFSELGHIVENRITVASLWGKLETLPAATLLSPVETVGMRIDEKGRHLLLSDGRQLLADLVVAADGSASPLRTMAGIGVSGHDYHQHGLVAAITTASSHKATARQRFLEQGPLAFLPLQNGQSSIVWTLSSDTAREYVALSDEDFLQKLTQASGGILGKMLAVGQRAIFPLRFQYADSYIGERLALIGDAAHAMHPLAGQGANAGLLDAAAIAELIIDAKQKGRPYSGQHLLRRYERWRKGDNLVMMLSMDALKRIFSNSLQPLVSLRSIGMNRINGTVLVKRKFNRYAMGLREDLPLLARGITHWKG